MGFFGNVFSAVIKTVLTPVAIVKDAIDVVQSEEPANTKELINSAVEDAQDALDDLTGG